MKTRAMEEFVSRGGLWVLSQSLLMMAVLALGPFSPGHFLGRAAWIPGMLLIAVGGYAGIAGVIHLGSNRSPYPKPLETAALVQHGIYAHVRHPLYLSVMTLGFGWALCWGSLPSLGAAVVTALFFSAKARREERWLASRFPHYLEYASRVPRFIPHLGRRRKKCNFGATRGSE